VKAWRGLAYRGRTPLNGGSHRVLAAALTFESRVNNVSGIDGDTILVASVHHTRTEEGDLIALTVESACGRKALPVLVP
jgi:hypothetical protein